MATPAVVQSTYGSLSGTSSLTFSHNAGSGSNRAVFVSLAWLGYPSGDQNLTSVTYGGQAMSLVDARTQNLNGEIIHLETWVKTSPLSGAQNVVATWPGGVYGSVGADSWNNVNQSTPWQNVAYAYDAGSVTQQVTVTGTTAGNIVRGAAYLYTARWIITYGQTGLWLAQDGRWAGAEYTTGGGNKTLSFANDPGQFTMHGFEIVASVDAPTNSSAPVVSGVVQVGLVVQTTTGTWTNSPTSYAYQWQRADDSGFTTNVTSIGTNVNYYSMTTSESGKYVRCVVTATNSGGSASANSNAVLVPPAPSIVISPALSGTAQVGQTITTTDGTWSGTPTGYSYQWQRADDSGFTTNVTSIGSNQNTFTLTTSESGKYVRCVVTATNASGSTAANSNGVGPILSSGGSPYSINGRPFKTKRINGRPS